MQIQKQFSLGAHPKIYTLGDRHIKELFDDEVIIQEKVDGSQFGFAKFNGDLYFRSKGKVLYDEDTTKSFAKIIVYLNSIEKQIPNNYVFYGEYLEKPRQNALTYGRTPNNHLVIFAGKNIETDEWLADHAELELVAASMGFETVPLLYKGMVADVDTLKVLLETESFLGKEQIEGFVVKNYHKEYQFANLTIPFLAGKYVREGFKERNSSNQMKNFNNKSQLEELKEEFQTEARWEKAIQYIRDNGELTDTPKDIGPLLKRINEDLIEEQKEYIKGRLWTIYSKEIIRAATYGFPEHYKKQLMEKQFDDTEDN